MSTNELSLKSRVQKGLKNFGPAFFIIGYVVGTGSVTSFHVFLLISFL